MKSGNHDITTPPANAPAIEHAAAAPARATAARNPARGDGRPPILTAGPTPQAILAAFGRRWFLALSLGLVLATAVGAGIWLQLPTTHIARTLLHISSQQPYFVTETPEVKTDFANYQRTQITLMKSRPVLNAALRDPKVRGLAAVQKEIDPAAWLEKEIKADYSLAPEILRITIAGVDADQLTVLLDSVRDAYLSEIVNKEHNLRLNRLDQLKKLYADYDVVLRDKRRALRTLADDLGSRDAKLLVFKQEFALKELAALQTELLDVQAQLRRAKLEALNPPGDEAPVALAVAEEMVEFHLQRDPVIEHHTARVARAEKELALLKGRFADAEQDPAYQRFASSLMVTRKVLTEHQDKGRISIREQLQEKLRSDQKLAQSRSQERIALLEKHDEVLSREIKERTEKNQEVTKKTSDLEWLKDEIAQVEEIAKKVATQVQNLQVEIQAPPRVKPLEETVVDSDHMRRVKVAGMGFAAMFGLVLCGVVLLEFQSRRVNGVDELTQGLSLRLMGTLPLLPKPARGGLGWKQPEQDRACQHQFLESLESTRLMLVNSAKTEALRTIMITSAFGGEGKTFLSSHLSINLARAGFRTLLIDGDLRRPSVHKLFNLSNEQGLCDVLSGGIGLDEAIRVGTVENLSILPAGEWPGQVSQLLAGVGIKDLLQGLKEKYDFIVIDAPPVLPVVDAQAMGQCVDGVVLSVLRGVSRLPSVYEASERLTLLKARILGAVLHGARGRHYYSSYANRVPSGKAKTA